MGTFTPKGYINELKRRQRRLVKTFGICVNTAHAEQVTRIFDRGQNSQGGAIGQYTNAPYRRKRQRAGRQVGFVDLKFSGNLRLDYSNGNRATKISETKYQVGTKRKENSDKVEGLEQRYGAIFKLLQGEVDLLKRCVINERKLIGI